MLKVQQLIPFLLGVASYFNYYLVGLFDQADGLEPLVLAFVIIQLYIYWGLFSWLQGFADSLIARATQKTVEAKHRLQLLIVCHLMGSIIISICVNLGVKLWFIFYFNNAPVIGGLHILVYALSGLFNGGMVLSIRLFLHSQVRYQQQQIKLSAITQEKNNAQLALLQAQIDPHFLFNNLNTLYSLINQDRNMANEYLLHFSAYLRRSFSQLSTPLVPLREELKELAHYLAILKIRFASGIDVIINEDSQDLRAKIPPLCLAELIENAVKHNEIGERSPLQITITITTNHILISNTRNPKRSIDSNGMGLENLNQRLRLLLNQSLQVTEDINRFTVTVPLTNRVYDKAACDE